MLDFRLPPFQNRLGYYSRINYDITSVMNFKCTCHVMSFFMLRLIHYKCLFFIFQSERIIRFRNGLRRATSMN